MLWCLALDLTVTNFAALTGIITRSVIKIFLKIRSQLAHECQCDSPFAGEVKIYESYFGPKKLGVKEYVEQDLKQSSLKSFGETGGGNT